MYVNELYIPIRRQNLSVLVSSIKPENRTNNRFSIVSYEHFYCPNFLFILFSMQISYHMMMRLIGNCQKTQYIFNAKLYEYSKILTQTRL